MERGNLPRYLFQRVVHNDYAWKAPSPGRLRFTGDGDYLEKTGFAHEDWNFAADVCPDGTVHGYMYYWPKDPEGTFNILFASYDKWDGWALAGYYKGAQFVEDGGNLPTAVLKRRAAEVKALEADASLGRRYRGKSVTQIAKLLRADQQAYPGQAGSRLPLRYFIGSSSIGRLQFRCWALGKCRECISNELTEIRPRPCLSQFQANYSNSSMAHRRAGV
jgi:hypothetical protein